METDKQDAREGEYPEKPGRFSWRRVVPLAVLAAAALAVLASGGLDFLSPRAIADSREVLQAYVHDHMAGAVVIFMLVYAVAVALSLPVGALLTVLGGFLFGALTASAMVVVSATAGATVIFLAAKTALGDLLAARSGKVVVRMREGFQENALSYMLFLRLVPAFPFALVNIAPAFLGVSLRTYVIGTFLGIIPGTVAFAFVGGGLDSILVKARSDPQFQACLAKEKAGEVAEGSCSLGLDFGDFVTTELLAAFVLLGVVALVPALWRMVRRRQRT